ncbi:hypothetical protein EUGRSUZ_G01450 [Eucalyptus grandis]|uniref:Uncharacterized protein n=2 Tax=Eucalyptus grandis TaxID=71139 RepID=A0ACC3K3G4_EUCGR|nr:hypothetical protein EUGRSUZ_G01450 [Eucalyptus grandis]
MTWNIPKPSNSHSLGILLVNWAVLIRFSFIDSAGLFIFSHLRIRRGCLHRTSQRGLGTVHGVSLSGVSFHRPPFKFPSVKPSHDRSGAMAGSRSGTAEPWPRSRQNLKPRPPNRPWSQICRGYGFTDLARAGLVKTCSIIFEGSAMMARPRSGEGSALSFSEAQ